MERRGFAEGKFNQRVFLIFTAGFLAGLAMIYIGRQRLVAETQFLGSLSVERTGLLDMDGSMLFLYSLRQRGGPVLLLILLSAAGAGGLAVCLSLVWAGFCAGVILSVLSLRYGIRGILLFVGGCVPQILFLIPSYLLLLRWCILLPGGGRADRFLFGGMGGKNVSARRFSFRPGLLILAFFLFFLGCMTEGYVNPMVLKKFFLLF